MTASSNITNVTMMAVVQDTYGTVEVLELRDVDRPDIHEDEVLIRVEAAGLNPADWALMNGLPYVARPVYALRRPRTRSAAPTWPATSRRLGPTSPGSTRLMRSSVPPTVPTPNTQPRPRTSSSPKPANLTFAQAAAVPMAGLVALQALRDHGNVRAGQQVLINGASGGIGHLAVQIANSRGAHVTGVSSTPHVDLVRSLGAETVIDYTQQDFTRGEQPYDFILENIANHPLDALRRVLTDPG
jgi:NADPH:quinone reductase-like Zn-dependent oxidoreductase